MANWRRKRLIGLESSKTKSKILELTYYKPETLQTSTYKQKNLPLEN